MKTPSGSSQKPVQNSSDNTPFLSISRIGLVSRDYWLEYPNGYRDFSYSLAEALKYLDLNGCDSVLFSLFSIDLANPIQVLPIIQELGLRNIRVIFLEDFHDRHAAKGGERVRGDFVVYSLIDSQWTAHRMQQVFGSLSEMTKEGRIEEFVAHTIPHRILGNCCILLCGETNGVKYSQAQKKVEDTYGMRAAIPGTSRIVLNPIHDRMTRFEMKLKRQFLSENGRYVVSIWNKGKKDKNGRVKDGDKPAWTIFHDGKEQAIYSLDNQLGLEIGILDLAG